VDERGEGGVHGGLRGDRAGSTGPPSITAGGAAGHRQGRPVKAALSPDQV